MTKATTEQHVCIEHGVFDLPLWGGLERRHRPRCPKCPTLTISAATSGTNAIHCHCPKHGDYIVIGKNTSLPCPACKTEEWIQATDVVLADHQQLKSELRADRERFVGNETQQILKQLVYLRQQYLTSPLDGEFLIGLRTNIGMEAIALGERARRVLGEQEKLAER